jgi:DNA repair exonuclease SbcCD ATPase subunit
MLNQITLKNFRQFEDRTFDFGAGNVTLRGPNEGGKTTVIEAFMYAIGGARQCRNNDFARWGAKPSQVKVEAVMTLQGTPVRVKRGPSGAEIYAPASATEPHVTGQTEVTNWFAEQLGAGMDVAAKMMFAGQKEIGGLLDEKNGKVIEFIEDMSGLDIVEWMIDQIKTDGPYGDTSGYEAALDTANEALAALNREDFTALMAESQTRKPQLVQALELARAGVADARQQAEARQEQLTQAEQRQSAINQAKVRVETREEDLAAREATLKDRQTESAALVVVGEDLGKLVADASTRASAEIEAIQAAASSAVVARNEKLAKDQLDLAAAVRQQNEAFQERQAALSTAMNRAHAYAALQAYKLPESEWEGTRAELEAYRAAEAEKQAAAAQRAAGLRVDLAAKRGELAQNTSTASRLRESVVEMGQKCPTCHQVIPDAEGVEAHNAKLLADAQEHDNIADALRLDMEALEREIGVEVGKGQEAAALAQEAGLILSNPGYRPRNEGEREWLVFDENFVPARPAWKGDAPASVKDQSDALDAERSVANKQNDQKMGELLTAARAEISALERAAQDHVKEVRSAVDAETAPLLAKIRERETAARRLEEATADVARAQEALATAQATLDEAKALPAPEKDVATLAAEIQTYRQEAQTQQDALAKAQSDLAVVNANIEHLESQIRVQSQERSRHRMTIDNIEQTLIETRFNNQLVADLARARPQLANQLWNMVLKGVSTYLTQMRREPSIVERDGKTFLINGKPYDSYSGSALDLLALGIRIALTKVFVPGASMMILDEPFAACSEERTLQCLSLVTASGFEQMVVITHEGGTETVFDKIVEV